VNIERDDYRDIPFDDSKLPECVTCLSHVKKTAILEQRFWHGPVDSLPVCNTCKDFFDSITARDCERYYGNDPQNITRVETRNPINLMWFVDRAFEIRDAIIRLRFEDDLGEFNISIDKKNNNKQLAERIVNLMQLMRQRYEYVNMK